MPLSYIITKENLANAFDLINKRSSGLDDVDAKEFQSKFTKNIETLVVEIEEGKYVPEPLKKIEIKKTDSSKTRPIGLSSIKDKLVQKVLYDALMPYFNKKFSSSSYAYRPGKSPLQAINRTTEIINKKNFHIVKSDIENFFETIDQDVLLTILNEDIKDKQLIRLLSLFMQIGGFEKGEYISHQSGVYQGDILSPLLSNIYLDKMDKYLENEGIEFVRFADDFVMLFSKKKRAFEALNKLKKFLKTIKLKLNYEKTHVVHISDGFEFLGVYYQGRNREIGKDRVEKSVNKINALSQSKLGFKTFVEELNSYLRVLKNYYLKIVPINSMQYTQLQDALKNSIVHKIYLTKNTKKIKTKKEFKVLVEQIELKILFDPESIKSEINHIIAMGYEKYLANKSYKDSSKKIKTKRNRYAKKFSQDTTLHIVTPGFSLGISKNRFVLKKYGKVQESFAFNKIKRVIFEGKGYSLSTDVIKRCTDNGIHIDFINHNALAYASLVTYKSSMPQIYQKQSSLLNTHLHIELAKAFVKGKAKNQLNYLKYLNKYHRLLGQEIESTEILLGKLKKSITVEELMGYEGSIAVSYWHGIEMVLEVPFPKRITYGAKDIVNSSLNYGYAFLYGEVQHALIQAGLNLNISFLHSVDGNKPTLTFDMIEEFRTFVVDRTIISMLNKEEPIKLASDGFLTKSTRKLIAKNIKEKLGSYTLYKKESQKIANIIQNQAYMLSKVVNGEISKYKPFVGKF